MLTENSALPLLKREKIKDLNHWKLLSVRCHFVQEEIVTFASFIFTPTLLLFWMVKLKYSSREAIYANVEDRQINKFNKPGKISC